MKKILLISIGALVLTACGGNDSSDASSANESVNSNGPASKLNAFMTEEKVCDVLPVAELKAMFKIDVEIKTQASAFRNTYACRYVWDAKDKEEREAAMIENIMASAQGNAKKKTLRERAIDHEVSITLSNSNKTAANFMPPILSQDQLNQQIAQAQKAADERLTDEQKEVAGGAAQNMVAGMLKKNNQNEAVEGVGDAAYWSKMLTGAMYVLDSNVSISIEPLITSSEEVDRGYAKQIFYQLIK